MPRNLPDIPPTEEGVRFVSRDRIVRLRSVMPDESPIDLDAHAAMIAYSVEDQDDWEQSWKRTETHIEVTRGYISDVRRFLVEIRQSLHGTVRV